MVRSVSPTMTLMDKILRREIRRFHQNVDRLSPVLGSGHLPSDLARSILSSRSLALSCPHQYQAKLSPPEVTNLLKANEYTNASLPYGPVKSFDTNTLQSNNPIEDSHSQALVNKAQGDAAYLFGIFDGHGGASCGQVVAKRLFHYIASGLLSNQDLSDHIKSVTNVPAKDFFEKPGYSLIKNLNDHFGLVQDLRDLYYESYKEHLNKLHSKQVELGSSETLVNMEEILINSFLSLDDDMSREAQRKIFNEAGELKQINMKTATVAMSGCVAAAAYIDGPHLSIASTGDCTAVVGSLSDTDTWLAKKLTTEHNSDNQKEVKRILSEHPENEHHHIIKGDRLLSILAPLRAFGDFKFKWDRNTIEETLGVHLGEHACPPNYKTPPYLTARPDITHHRLSPRDKFLVIGSDGLWDMMTPMQVVRLVGEHMSGKTTLSPLQLSDKNIPLKDIADMLKKRQDAMRVKPTDVNAATHLIRNALGGTAYGVDHSRLSQMLSLPQDMVRMFRDDITIQVVFFDEEYLRTC